MRSLTAFKSYDIRGRLGSDMDSDVAYRIGRALAEQFAAKAVVMAWDARESSPHLSAAATNGVIDAGSNVWSIGLAGTEEMYCATAEFGACCGLAITASHNPIDYNGIKLVKSSARPLDQSLGNLFRLNSARNWQNGCSRKSKARLLTGVSKLENFILVEYCGL